MAQPKWEKVIRNESEIKEGLGLCPICKKDTLEKLIKEDVAIKERCSEGCFVYNFETKRREK